MTSPKRILLRGLFVIWTAAVALARVEGAPVDFVIDPAQSQIVLSGNVIAFNVYSAPLSEQNPGSLTAAYSGTINADVSDATIEFTGASVIVAQTNAIPQQPAPDGVSGYAPADYGAMAQTNSNGAPFTLFVALRNMGLNIASPMLVLSNGDFASASLEFSFSPDGYGSLDYSTSLNLNEVGTTALSATSTDAASIPSSLTMTGTVQVLTISVNMTFTNTSPALNGTTLNLTGQFVATRTVLPPPNINSLIVTNQVAVITVANATAQSQVLVSPDLNQWSTPAATVSTYSNLTVFTLSATGNQEFFRVEQ